MSKHQKSELEMARDELMSHIHRCGVLKATAEQQTEWIEDTVDYMGERFPGLSPEEVTELRNIGTRFCQPVIAHGKGNTAISQTDEVSESDEADESDDAIVAESEENSDEESLVGAA
ncbi:MAG TPA: hypothetical protein VFI91_10795 [Longimicrobiaceae bacterium]|nr:hypothetical protein [Longimicrobiaceae bacterium]